ncbi:hypothetical protein BV20DRAFT_953055 [Pilatotrama ljubarskyi]|nr:hypothetical protein BV20DRAFT_953055 [Pilatotrama ljubarskyi]
MIPKCPICSSQLLTEPAGSQLVVLKSCGHVLCSTCFQAVIKNPPFLCPFRCGAELKRRLKAVDGQVVQLSTKEAEPASDARAAIVKRKAEIGRARIQAQKKQRRTRADISSLTTLIRNQQRVIAGRHTYIARESAVVETLREEVTHKQQAMYKVQARLGVLQNRVRVKSLAVSEPLLS